MTNLSSIAQSVLDKAYSEAKRYDNVEVGTLHLLLAAKRWQPKEFDDRFPGLEAAVRDLLNSSRGTATKVSSVAQVVIDELSSVRTPAEMWVVLARFAQDVNDQKDRATPTRGVRSDRHKADESVSQDSGDGDSIGDDVGGREFAVSPDLIELLSGQLSEDPDDLAARLLGDALEVAVRVTGDHESEVESRMIAEAALGVEPRRVPGSLLVVGQILNHPTEQSGRIATSVASVLVEVAEWAAGLDDNVTREETDRIDEIRLELRSLLGNRIDAQSDSLTKFDEKFAQLVGMESVKTEIRKRVDFLVVNKRRAQRGMKSDSHRMHMAFVGNPGTGKTTVARLYGELLNDLDLLPTDKFVETDRSGLIGRYIGETEEKTLSVVNSADGGVLFVDEAYALDDGYGERKGFGEEATDVLVKQMEDRRDRLVVIFAGYKDQTLSYMEINPGLKSRVPSIIEFPDYSIDELLEIARRIVQSKGLQLDESAVSRLRDNLESRTQTDSFGNARDVENLLEAAERNAVNRTAVLGNLATERELRTIIGSDFPVFERAREKRIGFSK